MDSVFSDVLIRAIIDIPSSEWLTRAIIDVPHRLWLVLFG